MSHAHEAAVAEARQAWRLEFWQRVADTRMARVRRLIEMCYSTMENRRSSRSDWNEATTAKAWMQLELIEGLMHKADSWLVWRKIARRLEWILWITLYPREEHAIWLGRLDWLKEQPDYTPQKAATP